MMRFKLLFSAGALACLGGFGLAPLSGEVPQISVTGTAFEEVVPDRMVWQLEIRTVHRDLAEAAEQHHVSVGEVLRIIRESGVGEDDVQTGRMQFGENWTHRGGSRVREGFFASTSVAFRNDDFDAYVELWQAFAQNEDVSVRNVGLEYAGARELRGELRVRAVKEAKRRAERMAAALEVKVGPPLLIDDLESGVSPGPMPVGMMRTMDAMGGDREQVVAPGQLTFESKVRVVFELR